MNSSSLPLWTCSRCLRAQNLRGTRTIVSRRSPFSTTTIFRDDKPPEASTSQQDGKPDAEEQGALSRRLAEMAEETMDTGSQSDRKLMRDAGFSDVLKTQLEERIAQTAFEAQNQWAKSQVTLPSSAGKGTRGIAGAEPWTGTESLPDAALRMLDDSHKRLRTTYRPPRPSPVNLRPSPKKILSTADRLAVARDKTSIYAISQQTDMSVQEKEKYRKELKERFTPGARPMPTSIQGLTSLANERIEDAISRGQFKNLPRGKGVNVERDYNANSPFLDTTEYFMNKIIQKQEIVPPWIEKQQELVKNVASFRGRLRNDWKRHAARMIAARGGSVADQVRRAEGYAAAEERLDPGVKRRKEEFSSIASDGRLTVVTVEERIAQGEGTTKGMSGVEDKKVGEGEEQIQITVTEQPAEDTPMAGTTASTSPVSADETVSSTGTATTTTPAPPAPHSPAPIMTQPFRDPAWEATELGYHTLAIQNLNALTRSYNLMAPKIAQKPYYSLPRELNRCFSDVAPLLPNEILERSRRPVKVRIDVVGHKEGGVLEKFAGEGWKGHEGVIRDEGMEKGYGFKQFWRDLFGKKNVRRRDVA